MSYEGSTATMGFGTILAVLGLWFGVSTPLVFVGSYFGLKREKIEVPVRTWFRLCLELWYASYISVISIVVLFHYYYALYSPSLLSSCSITTMSLHITIVLIITPKSFYILLHLIYNSIIRHHWDSPLYPWAGLVYSSSVCYCIRWGSTLWCCSYRDVLYYECPVAAPILLCLRLPFCGIDYPHHHMCRDYDSVMLLSTMQWRLSLVVEIIP